MVMLHCSISKNQAILSTCEPLTVLRSENKFAVSFASVKMTLWTHHWWQSAKVARILALDSQNKWRCAGCGSHAIPAQYYAMVAPSGLFTTSEATLGL